MNYGTDYFTEEQPAKVTIRIRKEGTGHYFMNKYFRNYGGYVVIKDTVVYAKDSTRVRELVKQKNEEFLKRRMDEFNKSR